MTRFVTLRLLAILPAMLGISFLTFLLMELAPGDAVVVAMQDRAGAVAGVGVDVQKRAEQARRLMVHHGLVDPATGAKLRFPVRYWRWLQNAARFRFAGSAAGSERFRERILAALPVTLLVNVLALLLAFAVAIPLAARAGMRPGSWFDRFVSGGAFVVFGVPEFLIATLALLVFCGGFFAPMLPNSGLVSPDAADRGALARIVDLAAHLVLPVMTLATGYGVVVFRFLRDSVARVKESDFVMQLRAFGAGADLIRRRVVRNGLSPVVTLLGTMLPTLVGGTVVVEKIFSLRGLGLLTTTAVAERDMPMVMALTMLVSMVTLVSLLASDILQRAVDPRVELR